MAVTLIRKRSPRAPTISLKDAVDRTGKIYEMEGRHPSSVDIVANHIGYKSADNGAAKRVLAALGYYGLIDRPSEGMLAVAKSFEDFKFTPSEGERALNLRKWLTTPPIFAGLLEKFHDRLPSEATLKFELIQMGFNPDAAAECLSAFVDSVQYVQSMSPTSAATAEEKSELEADAQNMDRMDSSGTQKATYGTERHGDPGSRAPIPQHNPPGDMDSDQIPVRLAGGRRAWLVIPSPFYATDKQRLISQIELLLTDDE